MKKRGLLRNKIIISLAFILTVLALWLFVASIRGNVEVGAPALGSRGDDVEGEHDSLEVLLADTFIDGGGISEYRYDLYSNEKLSRVGAEKFVLFFHANWCSACRAFDEEIVSTMQMIPENTLLLKVDFEKNIAMRTKYNVEDPYTFIQVDSDGNEVSRWYESQNIRDVLIKIQ